MIFDEDLNKYKLIYFDKRISIIKIFGRVKKYFSNAHIFIML